MKRCEFLRNSSAFFGVFLPVTAGADPNIKKKIRATKSEQQSTDSFRKPQNFGKAPFRRLVILGESAVSGGAGVWLLDDEERYADAVVRLINACQDKRRWFLAATHAP